MGVKLYFVNKLIIQVTSDLVQCIRCISVPLALRYDILGLRVSPSSSGGQKISFITVKSSIKVFIQAI